MAEPAEPARVFSDTATHYDVLGVEPGADIVELRRAFTVAAKKYHPDRVGGADAPFKRVQAAWEVVRDEGRRREYDNTLTAGRRPRYWESNEPEPTSPRRVEQEEKEKRLKQATEVPLVAVAVVCRQGRAGGSMLRRVYPADAMCSWPLARPSPNPTPTPDLNPSPSPTPNPSPSPTQEIFFTLNGRSLGAAFTQVAHPAEVRHPAEAAREP